MQQAADMTGRCSVIILYLLLVNLTVRRQQTHHLSICCAYEILASTSPFHGFHRPSRRLPQPANHVDHPTPTNAGDPRAALLCRCIAANNILGSYLGTFDCFDASSPQIEIPIGTTSPRYRYLSHCGVPTLALVDLGEA